MMWFVIFSDLTGRLFASPICSIIGNRSLGIFRSNIEAANTVQVSQGRGGSLMTAGSLYIADMMTHSVPWCNNTKSVNTPQPPSPGLSSLESADPDMI